MKNNEIKLYGTTYSKSGREKGGENISIVFETRSNNDEHICRYKMYAHSNCNIIFYDFSPPVNCRKSISHSYIPMSIVICDWYRVWVHVVGKQSNRAFDQILRNRLQKSLIVPDLKMICSRLIFYRTSIKDRITCYIRIFITATASASVAAPYL